VAPEPVGKFFFGEVASGQGEHGNDQFSTRKVSLTTAAVRLLPSIKGWLRAMP